jgi:hypothetical protein
MQSHPILKAIEDALGSCKGHLETIHSYTNDQNLVDNMHKIPSQSSCTKYGYHLKLVLETLLQALPSLEGN